MGPLENRLLPHREISKRSTKMDTMETNCQCRHCQRHRLFHCRHRQQSLSSMLSASLASRSGEDNIGLSYTFIPSKSILDLNLERTWLEKIKLRLHTTVTSGIVVRPPDRDRRIRSSATPSFIGPPCSTQQRFCRIRGGAMRGCHSRRCLQRDIRRTADIPRIFCK